MEDFRIAILGCGTIGGGTARVLLDNHEEFSRRAGKRLVLSTIVDLHPRRAAAEHGLPIELFRGGGADLGPAESKSLIDEIVRSDEIDLVVETIGGSSDYILGIALDVLASGKHLVTANKALLSRHGDRIFEAAEKAGRAVGFETSVCTSIPVIKAIRESFVSDEILGVSGIMNGTSNFILTRMKDGGLSFSEALRQAQEMGYAEADPSLDVSGGDAAHKLIILIKLAFGIDVSIEDLQVQGIQDIGAEDIALADELDCSIKLICYAHRRDGRVYGTVRPMMVKRSNLLSAVDGATNAVKLENRYTGENMLIGRGAGSLEGGSAVSSDIIFIARYADSPIRNRFPASCEFRSLDDMLFPYTIIFDTEDVPGITGTVTTAIGMQDINIDTVGHNRHGRLTAVFSVATMPCTYAQVRRAIVEIKARRPDILRAEPRILPILH
ncbi:MAG TPA: homoserine dehydrogenase [Rectinemataceae bacterium]|nr:homoserine dehydrogenase [Rectinemataceae bacterium]